MNIEKIKKLLEVHENIPFPQTSEEKMASWLSELAEVDGYYVGLAHSLIAGKPLHIDFNPLQNLQKGFLKLQFLEKGLIQKCENYLNSLEQLVKNL